jgi:signal peptidase II
VLPVRPFLKRSSVSRSLILVVALGIFGLDRWSKWLVETRLSPFDNKIVIPGFFSIVRSENPGVAFGLFADSTSRYRTTALIAFSLIALGILAGMLWKANRFDRLTAAGLSLIFGGAIGNVFDRVRVGRVTDFLDFYLGSVHWYAFNIADSAICIGAGLLLLTMWTKPKMAH